MKKARLIKALIANQPSDLQDILNEIVSALDNNSDEREANFNKRIVKCQRHIDTLEGELTGIKNMLEKRGR